MARAQPPITFDDLPLFATDEEIARAIVGNARAKEWVKARLPTLAKKPGFPPIDPFHNGRPTWLIRRFYEQYLGVAGLNSKPGPNRWRERSRFFSGIAEAMADQWGELAPDLFGRAA